MNAIVTVVGRDKVGIIAAVCTLLAEKDVNILDISQTILQGAFTMCAGAILNARIPRVFYGARDEAMGACGGVTNLFMESFPNRPALVGGILGNECREVLTAFFEGLRRRESGGQQKKTPPEKI